MRILALVPYPIGKGPSQRFRLEVFLPSLKDQDLTFDLEPFYTEEAYALLYTKGRFISKLWTIFLSYLRRIRLLFRLHRYDGVYIQREIGPLGFPWIAWLLKFVFKTPYVYDFDDAIWLPNYSSSNAMFHHLKMYSKTRYLIKWSSVCSAGNQYLADYASQFSSNVRILPTVVDTDNHHLPTRERRKNVNTELPVIGWTGTHSTIKYLEELFPLFEELEKDYRFELLVISNAPPSSSFPSLRYVEWHHTTEIDDLEKIDLGIMPLDIGSDDAFAQGKCGFKLIQYMALGIPAMASDVGVNNKIIDDGINGFLCHDLAQWKAKLQLYLSQPEEFMEMGDLGRKKVLDHYSVKANLDTFRQLFARL